MQSTSENPETPSYPLFAVTTTKLVVMYLLTVGFYGLYWFYKNWKAVKTNDDPEVMPFWRTFFLIFYIKPTFDKVQSEATRRGHDFTTYSIPSTVVVIATFYVAYAFPAPYNFLISLMGFIGLIPANLVAGKLNQSLDKNFHLDGRIRRWNWLAVLLAPLLYFVFLLGSAPGLEESQKADTLWAEGAPYRAIEQYEKAVDASSSSNFFNLYDYEINVSFGTMLFSYANSLPESESVEQSKLLTRARSQVIKAEDNLKDGFELFTSKGNVSYLLADIYVSEAQLAESDEDYFSTLRQAFTSYQAAALAFGEDKDWVSLSASYYQMAAVADAYGEIDEAIVWMERAVALDKAYELHEDLELDTKFLNHLKKTKEELDLTET